MTGLIFIRPCMHTMIHPNRFFRRGWTVPRRDGKNPPCSARVLYHVFVVGYVPGFAPAAYAHTTRRTEDFSKNLFAAIPTKRPPAYQWELWCNETDCMIGYHTVAVLADAQARAFHGSKPGTGGRHGQRQLCRTQRAAVCPKATWKLATNTNSVAKTLEYAYDDWCVAQLAQAAGAKEQETLYLQRSKA